MSSSPDDKRSMIKTMQSVFDSACKERKTRRDFVPDPLEARFVHTVPAYVLFEREAMLTAVNAQRSRLGLPAVDVNRIDRVERLASGHVDYCLKYPLYCAEIALGEDNPRP